MGAGHSHVLHRHGDTVVHRLPPEVKIAVAVVFTVAVVATPRRAVWAFGIYTLLVCVAAALARVPPGWLARRSVIELPFVVLALALPFVGTGERIPVLGLHLSVDGLWGGWNMAVKGTLGVLASLLLAATTTTQALIVGIDRLRCPHIVTQIATFMLRYLEVLAGEARRMRVARLSRGDDPRFIWQLRGFATGIGVLFLRAFERGERVYLAMISRGYEGRMPVLGVGVDTATPGVWVRAAVLPLVAMLTATTAVVTG